MSSLSLKKKTTCCKNKRQGQENDHPKTLEFHALNNQNEWLVFKNLRFYKPKTAF